MENTLTGSSPTRRLRSWLSKHQWGKKEGCSINVLLIEIKPKLNQKLKSINVQYTKLYKIMFNIQNYTMFLVSVCPGSLNWTWIESGLQENKIIAPRRLFNECSIKFSGCQEPFIEHNLNILTASALSMDYQDNAAVLISLRECSLCLNFRFVLNWIIIEH